jgi:hypothetical protein
VGMNGAENVKDALVDRWYASRKPPKKPMTPPTLYAIFMGIRVLSTISAQTRSARGHSCLFVQTYPRSITQRESRRFPRPKRHSLTAESSERRE